MANDQVNFADAAAVAQALKHQIRSGKSWDDLPAAAKESLDQIATAIARTVSGDGAHWDGIVGFAQAAKPGAEKAEPAFGGTWQPTIEPVPPNSRVEGLRAIERSFREIPARNDHG